MKIANKDTSAVQMVTEALEKAKKYQKSHNIFVSIEEESALARAQEIDEKIKQGENPGPLAGVPYALKDNFLSKTGRTTASVKILEPFRSPLAATAVEKLEQAGAIMIGRTNMDAFAHGSSTENSYFGPTHNAIDKAYVAGGSSGGSAVAVALDIVQFATGTDTGGSIRQPAAFNGVYGFKPTYGAISRYGIVAMASSTDCVGFFAKNPADIDLLMQITAGQDKKDMTTLPNYYPETAHTPDVDSEGEGEQSSTSRVHVPDGQLAVREGAPRKDGRATGHPESGNSGASARSETATIGIIKDFRNNSVDEEIQSALDKKIAELKQKGHEIKELEMPLLKYALAVYYIVVPAEIASNLARHDGIRYGYRTENIKDLPSIYNNSRSESLMPENKRRIMIGNFVLSSGFYDAYYLKAQKARTLLIKEYEKAFKQVDFLLTPVAPTPPFKLGEKTNDPIAMYLEDVMSVPLNLAGLPGLALPAGKTASGLPIGLQLIGPRRSDAELLRFAKELA